MIKLRFGLRSKLLLLSSFLVAIPWFGYQYVWEMEKYLRFGQEQTIIGTARALATSLHERPNLFNHQASFLPSVEKGKDLYSYQLSQPINLDGKHVDWPNFLTKAHYYGFNNLLTSQTNKKTENIPKPTLNDISHSFTATVGKFDKYVYFFFSVVDDKLIYRAKNARSITLNDRIELAFTTPDGEFQQYIISNKSSGWLDVFQTNADNNTLIPAPFIQGKWLKTTQGYNIEFRIPLNRISDNLAFALHDVDEDFGETISTIASADPSSIYTLGTLVVPSLEIERIVKGMSYTNSSIWVIDKHNRVLAKTGNIQKANGVWQRNIPKETNNEWHSFIVKFLKPLFDQLLTRPPKDFIDTLYDAQNLTGNHIESALQGTPKSQWRLSSDNKAVILTAAYPIYIGNKVNGVVVVEETNNGIRTVRNQALEKLFTSILAIILIGIFAFFYFASRISNRIRSLRNQAEYAIDEHGRINEQMSPSNVNDEIGDLSRSFSMAVSRLGQYNQYLINMSSRLSHELRTPIAVVRTSLDNLTLQSTPEKNADYIQRAQEGLTRLNLILTNMSEATRLEQMLQTTDKLPIDIFEVINGCVSGYKQIYRDHEFIINTQLKKATIQASPEHIAQLLDKVISNAIDFSCDKKISISIVESNTTILIHISNNGAYLPDEMTERLFDSMVSIRGSSKEAIEDKRPHLGLGLYMARLICEFHHGQISANNHHNPKGVTITIKLPLA